MTAVPQTAKGQPSTVLTVQPDAAQAIDNDWEKLAKNADNGTTSAASA